MAEVQIQKMRATHDAILEFLIANPGPAMQRRCAAHFGVTEAWLSVIINSDIFQAAYRDRRDELFAANIVPLHDKLMGVAHLGVDKLADILSKSSDPDFVKDATDKILHRLGYAPSTRAPEGPRITQNNYYGVNSNSLASARARCLQKGATIDGDDLAATAELSYSGESAECAPRLESPVILDSGTSIPRGEGKGEGVRKEGT
jgi:hypothetical protein